MFNLLSGQKLINHCQAKSTKNIAQRKFNFFGTYMKPSQGSIPRCSPKKRLNS